MLACLAAVSACAPRPRTQAVVLVGADEALASQIEQVRVRVLGGPPGELVIAREETVAFTPERPLRVVVVPAGGDAMRRFSVEATALGGGQSLGVVRTVSRFQLRDVVTIELRFEACCARVPCDETQTCRSCQCVSASEEMPDASVIHADAPAPDAGADAFVPSLDAYVSPDAFDDPCPTSSCVRVPLLSAIGFSPERGAFFARPVGTTCPASALSTPDFGRAAFYVYNGSSRARTLRLTTQRFGDPATSYDPALIAYDAVRVGSLTPSDPRACSQASDDAVGLDAELTLMLEPMQTKLIVLTGGAAGEVPIGVQVRIEQL